MVDKDLRLRILKVRKPFEEPFLIGMSRESSQGVDMGFYRNLFSEEPDALCSIDNPSSDRSLSLIADDDNMGFLPPEVVLQMMLDPSGVTHSARRDDDPRSLILVDRF